MNTGYADVPNPLDLIAHCFRRERGFLGNRNIAGARGYDGNRPHASFRSISLNSYQARSAVPLGIGRHVAHFTESSFVGMRNQNIGRAFDQALDDAHYLGTCLPGPEDNFGKALTAGPRVIDSSIADVLEVQIPDLSCRLSGFQFTGLVSR